MTTPVNFPLAKLLKEKRFYEPCLKCYLEDGSVQISSGDEGDFDNYNHNQWDNYSAPTIAEVVMWLYEKYEIWVVVDNLIDNKFYFSHRDTKANDYASRSGCNEEGYNTPTEAYEAAIEYVLNNLI